MKINVKNFLEMKQSNFIVLYSNHMNDITSKFDLKVCEIESCLYKICSGKQWQPQHKLLQSLC